MLNEEKHRPEESTMNFNLTLVPSVIVQPNQPTCCVVMNYIQRANNSRLIFQAKA